jgi:hypothetical protein
LLSKARIHSQFESLGFVGKYEQSPTNIVNMEIRGSGFSAKSSDFLPPKWSKIAGSKGIFFRLYYLMNQAQLRLLVRT